MERDGKSLELADFAPQIRQAKVEAVLEVLKEFHIGNYHQLYKGSNETDPLEVVIGFGVTAGIMHIKISVTLEGDPVLTFKDHNQKEVVKTLEEAGINKNQFNYLVNKKLLKFGIQL